MKIKIYLIAFTALFIFQLHAQWNPIDSITQGNIYSINFSNADTGFVFSEPGKMRRTLDGGQNWDTAAMTFSGYIHDVDFGSAMIGYAVGGAWFPFGTHYPLAILKTTDGGLSWDSIFSGSQGGVFDYVEVLSGQEFFATSQYGMLHSADGGLTFDTVSVDNQPWGTEQYGRVRFLNANHGYVMSRSNFFTGHLVNLYETTNGGKNWVSIHEDTTTNFTNDFVMTAAGNGVIVGNDSYVMRTTDGGNSWQQIPLANPGLLLTKIEEVDGHIYAMGSDATDTTNGIYYSADWGDTWQKQYSRKSNTGGVVDLSIPTLHTGYFATWNTVFKNDQLVSLSEQGFGRFEIYPNPTSEILNLSMASPHKAEVVIYNAQGTPLIFHETKAGTSSMLDISTLKKGVYFITLKQEGGTLSKKWVKY